MTAIGTIMIVDDSEEILEMLDAILYNHYSVIRAKSGREALKILEQSPLPDLILLDIMMADMNGFDVCTAIKDNSRTRDIPVIFLSAMGEHQDIKKGYLVGAVDYLTKPIDVTILLSRVESHVRLQVLRKNGSTLDNIEQLINSYFKTDIDLHLPEMQQLLRLLSSCSAPDIEKINEFIHGVESNQDE